MRKPVWWIAGAVILISAAVLFFSWRASRKTVVTPPAPGAAVVASPAAPAVANPLPQPADTGAQPLPSLESSDGPFGTALVDAIGKGSFDSLFRPEMLLRHIVVTVDNLSRRRLAVELRPTKPVAGQFIASGNDEHGSIDPANYQRYAPYVQTLQTLDPKRLIAVYFRFYPLFQQAYQSLGYPNGYFNDRLVETIDNLLATPEISGEIALVRPNVMYQFADPKLEALSAGQKALLRMGPDNAAIVKSKLRELRALIAARARDTERSRN
jgi:hypothetical protein